MGIVLKVVSSFRYYLDTKKIFTKVLGVLVISVSC